MCLSMKTCSILRPVNRRTDDSHYHWTKKWGAGHMVGLVTETGLVAMESAPGTHAIPNVPMGSLPVPLVFVSVTVSSKSGPSATAEQTALALVIPAAPAGAASIPPA